MTIRDYISYVCAVFTHRFIMHILVFICMSQITVVALNMSNPHGDIYFFSYRRGGMFLFNRRYFSLSYLIPDNFPNSDVDKAAPIVYNAT